MTWTLKAGRVKLMPVIAPCTHDLPDPERYERRAVISCDECGGMFKLSKSVRPSEIGPTRWVFKGYEGVFPKPPRPQTFCSPAPEVTRY